MIGKFVVGENASGHDIRSHDSAPSIALSIQCDTGVWRETADEHVSGSGQSELFLHFHNWQSFAVRERQLYPFALHISMFSIQGYSRKRRSHLAPGKTLIT